MRLVTAFFKELCGPGTLKDYLRALRVESWFGWIFNFAFGGVVFDLPPVGRFVLLAFAFSLATASVFVQNQYFDREVDQENEAKKKLPVASGRITPQGALAFSILLASLCIILVFVTDVHLLPLFLIYFGIGIAYSAPPLHFKTLPVADFIIVGVGAGLLPFVMGLEVTRQLSDDLSLPWVRERYFDALLTVIPLMLFHFGSHIIQAVGDFEADRKTGISTFVVKYGKKKGVIAAELIFLVAAILPFIYLALGLRPIAYLPWFLVVVLFLIPPAIHFRNALKKPTESSFAGLQKIANKYGPPAMAILWVYVLLMRMVLL